MPLLATKEQQESTEEEPTKKSDDGPEMEWKMNMVMPPRGRTAPASVIVTNTG
jgi:hypothetical protein